jgi:hypothetical protein
MANIPEVDLPVDKQPAKNLRDPAAGPGYVLHRGELDRLQVRTGSWVPGGGQASASATAL